MGFRQSFEYFLPRTVVRFSGRRTETVDALADQHAVELEGAVECVEQADPEWPLRISVDGTFFRDREGSIAFTGDRRLMSLSATSTGTASALTTGAVRFVTSAVAAVASIRSLDAEDGDGQGDPVEAQYTSDCPEAAANRTEIRAAVVANRQALVRAAVRADEPGDHIRALRQLRTAMTVLTDLQTTAEQHFAAWRASKKTTHTQDLAYEVPVLSLPSADAVDAALDDLTPELLGACWEPFQRLGVLAAVTHAPHRTPDAPDAGTTSNGFHYRTPRRVWLSVYEQAAGTSEVRLVERRGLLVYDATCATEYVSCDSGAWHKKTVAVELDAGSGLSRITTSAQGGAGAVGAALSGAADDVVKGLADAQTITTGVDTIRDRAVDRRIAQLDRRTKLAEAEVAADTAAADTAKLREIARLSHEKELLTARKEVAALAGDAGAKRVVISLEP